MMTATNLFHLVNLAMFAIGGVMSKGKKNKYALICFMGLLFEAMIWTGAMGSIFAAITGK